MKKFLRIALVFALAGATLMYTGCTKDYSGDIEDLNSEVSSLQSTVQSLQTQVASALTQAQTALSEAQAAAKSAEDIAAAKKQIADLEKRIADLEKAQAQLDGLKEQLTEDVDAMLDEQYDAIVKEVERLLAEASLTSIEAINNSTFWADFAKFNGVYDQKGKAAEWKGPRANELPEKGSVVTGTYVGYPLIQVNPSDYDVESIDFTIENTFGDEYPFYFMPVAYEDLASKSTPSGLYYLLYQVKPFESYESAKAFAKSTKNTAGTYYPCAIVANGNIRTNYAFTVKSDEIGKTLDPGDNTFYFEEADNYGYIRTNKLTGTATVGADLECDLFDWYITKVVSPSAEAQARIGLKFEGQAVTYDPELLEAYIEDYGYPTVTVEVSSLSISGYIQNPAYATFSFAAPRPAKVETVEFDWASDTIKHQAVIASATTPQAVKVDLKDAFAAWGITGKDLPYYEFLDEDFDYYVDAYYYATDDDFIGKTSLGYAAFKSLGIALLDNTGKFAPKATLSFATDYWVGTTDLIGETIYATIYFYKGNDIYYQVNDIPVAVSEPNFKSWFSWDAKTIYVAASTKDANDNYKVVDLTADKYFKPATGTGATLAYTTSQTKANGVVTAEYIKTFVKATDKTVGNAIFAPNHTWFTDGYMVAQYDAAKNVTSFKLAGGQKAENWVNPQFIVRKNATADYTLTGLKVKALGDRTYAIDDLTLSVVSIDEGAKDFAINFTPSVTLKRLASDGNYWFATNSAFEDAIAGTTYMGAFTLTGENGNKIALLPGGAAAPTYDSTKPLHTEDPADELKKKDVAKGEVVFSLVGDLAGKKYIAVEDNAGNYRINVANTKYVKFDEATGNDDKKADLTKPRVHLYQIIAGAPGVEVIANVETATSKNAAGAWVYNVAPAKPLFNIEAKAYSTTTGTAYGLKIYSDENRTESVSSVHVRVTFNKAAIKYASTNGPVAEDPVVEFDINFAE